VSRDGPSRVMSRFPAEGPLQLRVSADAEWFTRRVRHDDVVKVIGAGWGRTGTTSVAAALDRLGFGPVLQMQELWAHPDLAELWNQHHEGTQVEWPSALRGWASTMDWPGCWQWQEFARLWPDAPVLLTVRDPDSWYQSVIRSIHAWCAPGEDVGPPAIAELLTYLWDTDFGGWDRALDKQHAIACYERHNAQVRAECPPERLIEFSVQDGWEPLCRALQVSVPAEEFPHLNQS
jgi:hypothetical protein